MSMEDKYAEVINYISIQNEYGEDRFYFTDLCKVFNMTTDGIKRRVKLLHRKGYLFYRAGKPGLIKATKKGRDFLAQPFGGNDATN